MPCWRVGVGLTCWGQVLHGLTRPTHDSCGHASYLPCLSVPTPSEVNEQVRMQGPSGHAGGCRCHQTCRSLASSTELLRRCTKLTVGTRTPGRVSVEPTSRTDGCAAR